MKQTECPSCALMIDGKASICPYCGYEFPGQKRYLGIVAIALVVLLLIWLLG